MLEGDIPQDKMTCLFFVKEGIRKLSDLNTEIGNNTIYFNRWRLFARTSSVEQELEPQKIEKAECDPVNKSIFKSPAKTIFLLANMSFCKRIVKSALMSIMGLM